MSKIFISSLLLFLLSYCTVEAQDIWDRGDCIATKVKDVYFCETPEKVCFIQFNYVIDTDGNTIVKFDCRDNLEIRSK